MPRFVPRTFSDFFTRLISRTVARSNLTDLEEGGQVTAILSAVANELDAVHYDLTQVKRLWDLDTCTDEDLDERGKDMNPDEIERLGPEFAVGTVVFSRSGTTGEKTIPAGWVVRTTEGVEYRTTAPATIADGNTSSGSTAAKAIVAGSAGNCIVGAINGMDPINGVNAVTNDTEFSGGLDKEPNEQYRDRLKAYTRSLSRATTDALRYAALGVRLEGYGRVVSAEVVEGTGDERGKVWLYVDDGAGTVKHVANNYGAAERVTTATGGELRLDLDHRAVLEDQPVTVTWTPIATGVPVVLAADDFELNAPRGKLRLLPGGSSGIPTSGLAAGDTIDAEYSWYEGLIAEVQKVVDGDRADRANYKGYRGAGDMVYVLPPTVYQQVITATLVLRDGYDRTTVVTAAKNAILRYINGLGINGDVVFAELIRVVKAVPGVYDVTFTTPTQNTIMGEGELARAKAENINLIAA